MKFFALLMMVLFSGLLSAQVEITYAHCDCKDLIDQMSPDLSGNYQRICNDKTVETGHFEAGEKMGKWETFSLTGKKIREFNYTSGILDGDVRLFYSDGTPQVEGQFSNGYKTGNWNYYNKNGRLVKSGSFENGQPLGNWIIFNAKGKKEVIVYDFSQQQYISNNKTLRYFDNEEIIQNDNKGEWFILYYPERELASESQPVEGYGLSNDLLITQMEVPLEIWDTYLSLNYQATLKFEDGRMSEVALTKLDNHLHDVPEQSFIIITNEKGKLSRVEHTDLSIRLLEYKIKEALWLTGPYVNTEDSIVLYVPYVVNEIINRH